MFKPVKMSKINILVLYRHLKGVTRVLGDSGVVHLVNAVAQSRHQLLRTSDLKGSIDRLEGLLTHCTRLTKALGVDLDAAVPEIGEMTTGDIQALLARITDRYQEQDDRIAGLLSETSDLGRHHDDLKEYPLQNVRLDTLRNLSYFHSVAGRLSGENFLKARQALADKAIFAKADSDSDSVLVLTSRKNRWSLQDTLDKFGFVPMDLPDDVKDGTVLQRREELEAGIRDLQQKLEECRLQVLRISEEYGGVLLAVLRQLRGLLAVERAQVLFGKASHLYCISGWLPTEELDNVRRMVLDATDGTGVIEAIDADQDERVRAGLDKVPVKLEDSTWKRPFQSLVMNFSVPSYHEIDPSVLVGITFVTMFGYMFGDLGQGLVLGLVGLYLKYTRRPLVQAARDVGAALCCCSLSAMFFGLCYGSVFGYETHARLWLSPLQQQDLPKLLLTAVGLGITFLSVSIMVNVANHFLARRYYEGIFDKYGVFGILFYWGCIGIGINLALGHPFRSWHLVFVLVPLLLIFLKKPLHNLIRHGNPFHGDGVIGTVLESCIEILETLTGFLSGTVSFVRVGAFAISHAALCLAVFTIVGMLQKAPLGGLVSAVVIVLGNALIIAFEGMVAAIQCVRLEYYEIFSRFFQGDGTPYQPFRISDANPSEPIDNDKQDNDKQKEN